MRTISKSMANALRAARGEEAKVLMGGGSFKYIRYILDGERIPTISQHQSDLIAGILIGELIVNRITRKILADHDLREKFVVPFFNAESLEYIMKYIGIHGIQEQRPLVSRTDMLMNSANRLMALEVNPDAPEGSALTRVSSRLQSVLFPNKDCSSLSDFFLYSYLSFLNQNDNPKAVIPFWSNAALRPVEAKTMATLLQARGFDVIALPVESLELGNPLGFQAVLRNIGVATGLWKKEYNLFSDPAYISLPMYPAPWTDVGGLKHWFAFLYQMVSDAGSASQFGISQSEIQIVSAVLSPTFGPPHQTVDEMFDLFQDEQTQWIAKMTYSSHGEGLRQGGDVVEAIRSGQAILQRRVEGFRSGKLLVLHPNGTIKEESGWLLDMDPMGQTPGGGIAAVIRTCPEHPMNLAGENGGGAFDPYYY